MVACVIVERCFDNSNFVLVMLCPSRTMDISNLSCAALRMQAFGYGVLPGGDVDEVEIPSNMDVDNLV